MLQITDLYMVGWLVGWYTDKKRPTPSPNVYLTTDGQGVKPSLKLGHLSCEFFVPFNLSRYFHFCFRSLLVLERMYTGTTVALVDYHSKF